MFYLSKAGVPRTKLDGAIVNTPFSRPGASQPSWPPPMFLLASDDGSYISGPMIPVTGGRPML